MTNIGGGRAVTRCDQCGQQDDHPKAIIGDASGRLVSKHHDCLGVDERDVLVSSGQEKGATKASAIIDACEGGLRGKDLLEKIQSGDLAKATGKGGRDFSAGNED